MPTILPYEEAALLRALAEGDRASFTSLYSRYLDSLYQYVLLFTGAQQEAEEVVQDTFLKIWEKRDTLGEIGSFKAYLFRMAKNQILNHIQREQVRTKVFDHVRRQQDVTANAQDTQLQVDYRQARDTLREAIRKLPNKRKQIFILSTEESLSLDEIAGRLGITKNVVKKQLYEAFTFVRDYLAEHGELSAYLILLMTLLQA